MKFWVPFAVVANILSWGGPALAQPQQSNAIGNWSLEPSPARCVISRRYGPAESPLILAFKAPPLGDAIQILIIRPGVRARAEQSEAKITIGTSTVEATALSYPISGRRMAHLINLPDDSSASLRSAGEIKVRATLGVERTFSLAPIAGAWALLDACREKLRASWNMGKEQRARIGSYPQPLVPLEKLFSSADYPLGAMLSKQGGTTSIILLVDEQGMAKDCTLEETSGFSLLDSHACGIILSRAKFAPATDLEGKPIKSAIRRRIKWDAG